jgi:hypothetical protein
VVQVGAADAVAAEVVTSLAEGQRMLPVWPRE